MHGVAVTGLDHATYQHRRLLADYGFTPLQGSDELVLTGQTDNIFIHARQTVATLRSTGAHVDADPAFDYDQHPGHTSPATVTAGADPRIVTAGADIAVGAHPEHRIVATNHRDNPDAARLLARHGFYRTPDHPTMFSLTQPDRDGLRRATDAVTALRAAGLSVTADLPYEPRTTAEDPFLTRVIKADEQAPKPPSHTGPGDPFLTEVVRADPREKAGEAAPAAPKTADPEGPDRFNTRLHPTAPAVSPAPDARTAALVTNRQDTLAAIEQILSALSQQLRDDPQALDPAQVAAVLSDAQTTLGGVRQDLETISAATPASTRTRTGASAPAARPAATATLGARAQAARATSLRLGRVSAAQPVEAATKPVDPRREYSIHTR
ncbi:hypothetical protein [Kitasatospora sp. NPDC057015]|uniref:hypothetical protein n=1 Tax=Kitasatospora sp. NPDC057015 TaxID=3346001 RepID=UPI00364101E0